MFQYAHPEVLVDTQWVIDHLSDPNVRLVEADMSPQTYNAGHIPGAVFWNATDLLLPDQRINFDIAALEGLLARSGITNYTTVIAYGSHPAVGARAGHTWFVLKYLLGYPNVRNYDGSWNEWSRLPDLVVKK